jgi:outer membrane protein TolC
MKVSRALVVMVVSVPASVVAQPVAGAGLRELAAAAPVAGGLTAEEAAQRALAVSPELKGERADVAKATAEAHGAALARVPRLGATLGYTRLSDIDPPALGPGISFPVLLNSTSASVQLAVPVSDYLLTFPDLLAAARLGTDAARSSENAAAVAASHGARLAYYEWVRARLHASIGEQLLAQVHSALAQVQALTEAHRMSRADLLRVEAQRAAVQQTVAQLQSGAVVREQHLRLLIGDTSTAPLTVGEDITAEVSIPGERSVDELLERAAARRSDVRTLDAGIAALQSKRRYQRAGAYPRLSVFGQVDYANPNTRVVPVHDQFDFTWAVGAQLSWTLNDTLSTQVALDTSDAEIRKLRASRELLLRGIRLEVVSALQTLAVVQATLVAALEGLKAAEEGYRVRRELLAAERATAVELVDADTQVTSARLAVINARIDLRVALVKLNHASGADELKE